MRWRLFMFKKYQDDKANQYIREKIHQARQDAGKTQEDLAFVLHKNRVAISDLERGRVAVNASGFSPNSSLLRKTN